MGEINETDGFLSCEDLVDAARILKQRAKRYPLTWWRVRWRVLQEIVCLVILKVFKRYPWTSAMKYHTAMAGRGEFRLVLTYRPGAKEPWKPWHLSVLPCRFGYLKKEDEADISEAFKMEWPGITTTPDGAIHFTWKDKEEP